jgi:hypothetical protein
MDGKEVLLELVDRAQIFVDAARLPLHIANRQQVTAG